MNQLLKKLGYLGFITVYTLSGVVLASLLTNLSNNLAISVNMGIPLLQTIDSITGTMNTSYIESNGVINFLGTGYGGETLNINSTVINRANAQLNGTLKIQLGGNITGGEFSESIIRIYENGTWKAPQDITSIFNASPYTYSRNITWTKNDTVHYEMNNTWNPLISNGTYTLNFTVILND